ncbi:4-hydroxythreonine-4-phosphate dehydrogenase [Coriobacterium glomerans PW2]|uniref:4-hydroxythreonine-4-phosphate dehydrogenase n=1 Tax=Coriobacterium glomerans (strain ATCC 49209 / DSM 20642 / JCM 10262 / PW2) TaxID=700015 RepID=F2NA55_CORGP|nr:4-hydroxythreonine-4-phosphate dehydrogenase PdxA [Coriobacterium glomerans]AEB06449.1 4-hydroxythreonine-4-phosphate dehydrogenase [Coriobacterium glomerans PW2]
MANTRAPIVAITMGDPAGNGPELTVKALAHQDVYRRMRPVVVGDASMIEMACGIAGHPEMRVRRVERPDQARFEPGVIDVVHLDLIDADVFEYGRVSAMCGMAAFKSVVCAIELAMRGDVDATCTNALNKEAMNLALKPEGKHFAGHTEIYASYTGTSSYAMMLAFHDLRVVHVSTHCSLAEACRRVKTPRVLEVIKLANDACHRLGIEHPRIAVAGLNPHAGEGGLFGREEIDEIAPAIELAAADGIDVEGPLPPDSLFCKALGGWYDIVIAMYHDQGHIALKTVGFVYDRAARAWKAVEGVNVTLGLPIIRTSVDHGTGFDQAGKGRSNELSLLNALDFAARMASGEKEGHAQTS